jgi:hypothetical protein
MMRTMSGQEVIRSGSPGISESAIMAAGLGLIALLVVGVTSASSYSIWGGLIVGIVLFEVSIPILAREAAREGDRRLFWLLVLALLLKFGAAIVAHYVAYTVYQGASDVVRYHNQGAALGEQFRSGDFHVAHLTGTDFPIFLNGVLYAIVGPTRYGGFLVHSWLSFWGLFLFYRAFRIAAPDGHWETYARLLFFLPSLVLWSSLMGKEPWMVLSLGIATYGVARGFSGQAARGLLLIGMGIWFMALVRPHVAAIVGISAGVAYLVKRLPSRLREVRPVVKTLGVVVFTFVAVVSVVGAQQFLHDSGIDTGQGLTHALEQASQGGAYGGSQFTPTIVSLPTDLPLAAVTVLFRPLPIDGGGETLQMIAALEGTFLLLLSLARWRSILNAIRTIRDRPYVAYVLAYTGLFIIAFSSVSNFGLLARQRVQLMPLFLVLLSLPIPDVKHVDLDRTSPG